MNFPSISTHVGDGETFTSLGTGPLGPSREPRGTAPSLALMSVGLLIFLVVSIQSSSCLVVA